MSIRLGSLAAGDEFRWCGVRFKLDSLQHVQLDGAPRLAITYLETTASGFSGPGTPGIMSPDEYVEPLTVGTERRAPAKATSLNQIYRDAHNAFDGDDEQKHTAGLLAVHFAATEERP